MSLLDESLAISTLPFGVAQDKLREGSQVPGHMDLTQLAKV